MQNISSTIESYLISLISKYLRRYTSNFGNQQAVELSLWQGEGLLRDLELDVESINKELVGSPLALVEGRLGQLRIKVPWARIYSKPIEVALDRLEISFRIKSVEEVERSRPTNVPNKSNQKHKKGSGGWATSLGVKTASNLKVTLREIFVNLVDGQLKLLLQVRTVNMEPANPDWFPEFNSISAKKLTVRNLIQVNGVKVGLEHPPQIETVIITVVDSCTFRFSRNLKSIYTLEATSVRIGIYSTRVRISISHHQIPLIIRLIHQIDTLLYILDYVCVQHLPGIIREETSGTHQALKWIMENIPVLPVTYPTWQIPTRRKLILKNCTLVGLYINRISIRFNMREGKELICFLGGVFCEVSTNIEKRVGVLLGISMIEVTPSELPNEHFVSCGNIPEDFLLDSIYLNMERNFEQKKLGEHQATLTPDIMNKRAESLAIDILTDTHDKQDSIIRKYRLTRLVIGRLRLNLSPHFLDYVNEITRICSNFTCSTSHKNTSRTLKEAYQIFVYGASFQ